MFRIHYAFENKGLNGFIESQITLEIMVGIGIDQRVSVWWILKDGESDQILVLLLPKSAEPVIFLEILPAACSLKAGYRILARSLHRME
jgi:hypothetical protein